MLMLETASPMMADRGWAHSEATVTLSSQGDEEGSFALYGANLPDAVRAPVARTIAALLPIWSG